MQRRRSLKATVPALWGYNAVKPVGNHFQIKTYNGTYFVKPCSSCNRMLPLKEFYMRRSDCKECHMQAVRSWQKKNPERLRELKSAYNKKYRERQKQDQESHYQ